jgi:hypothetical protein
MKSFQLVIYRSQRSAWVQLRDLVLLVICWGLWGAVIVSIYRGDGFHFSSTYLLGVAMLSAFFLMWSGGHYLWSPIRTKSHVPPLSLKKVARQFHLQSELVQYLQYEKQVILELNPSGILLKSEAVQ